LGLPLLPEALALEGREIHPDLFFVKPDLFSLLTPAINASTVTFYPVFICLSGLTVSRLRMHLSFNVPSFRYNFGKAISP